MAIFGKFRVELPKDNLRNMKVDTGAYIFCSKFVLSKSLLCIPKDTEVFYKIEDVQEADFDNYVAIYKFDNNFNQDSFHIDLNEDTDFDVRDWYLSPGAVTQNYLKSEDWVCFENPPIFYDEVSYTEDTYQNTDQIEAELETTEAILDPVTISNLSLKELNQKLRQAVANENYELAAKIRDEISRKINKSKKP
jgi:hypothetical protein